MNTYFWYQQAKLNTDDKIYWNLVEQTDVVDRADTFRIINEALDQAGAVKTPWCGNVDDKFLFRGYFDSKDECGRLMSFYFVSDQGINSEIDEQIKSYLSMLGFCLDKQSLVCFERWKKAPTHYGVWILIAAAVLLCLIGIVLLIVNK